MYPFTSENYVLYTEMLSAIELPNGSRYEFTYNRDYLRKTYSTYVWASTLQITEMTLPTGATVSFDYTEIVPSWWTGDPGDPGYSQRLTKYISEIVVDPLDNAPLITTYDYETDTSGYISETTETRPDGSKKIVSWNPQQSQYDDFLRDVTEITDTNGTTVLQTITTGWTEAASGVYVDSTQVTHHNPDATDATYEITRSVDDFGRPLWEQIAEGSGLEASMKSTWEWDFDWSDYYGYLTREDKIRFHKDTSTNYVVSSTRYEYDQFSLVDRGSVVQHSGSAKGLPTTVKRFLHDENRFIQSTTTYDETGNPVTQTDPLNHTTTIDYSSAFHYAYPTKVTNHLGHEVETNYNFYTGVLTSTIDANDQTMTFSYDTYNRLVEEEYPDGGWKTYTYNDTYFTGAFRTYLETEQSIDATNSAVSTQYFDGIGRPIRAEVEQASGPSVMVDQVYAQCTCSGKAKKVSMPYFSGDTVYWTETQYDGLGRVKKVIPPDGSASSNNTEYKYYWEEDNWSDDYPKTRSLVGVFDAKGKGRVYVHSASGELLEVREDPNYSDLSSSVVTRV